MFSGFFGKDKKVPGTPSKDAVDSRGLEVNEGDQDTAWSMWDSALAQQDSKFNAAELEAIHGSAARVPLPQLPSLPVDVDLDGPTVPMSLAEKSPEQRKDDALRMVEAHHPRIANTIRTLWGYKECSVYIAKLILNGNDGTGHARAGFHQQAVEAMLYLADLHDAEFGAEDDGNHGFANTTQGTGWGKLR